MPGARLADLLIRFFSKAGREIHATLLSPVFVWGPGVLEESSTTERAMQAFRPRRYLFRSKGVGVTLARNDEVESGTAQPDELGKDPLVEERLDMGHYDRAFLQPGRETSRQRFGESLGHVLGFREGPGLRTSQLVEFEQE